MAIRAASLLISALFVRVSLSANVTNVTEAEVLSAQRAWGDALVNISTTFDQSGFAAAKAVAERVIDEAYGYQFGPVLFKPTLAYGNQTFRTTRAGALAYFVGGDPAYPDDKGFAFKGWRKVEIENAAIFRDGNTGTSVGNVILTNMVGAVTVVDKTWQFVKGAYGRLRIMGHHSSLPYVPTSGSVIAEAEVLAAQIAWGEALVNISTAYDQQGYAAAKAAAERVIDDVYGYQYGPVLFKPTLAYGNQTFRTTRAGALSYFVGGDAAFPSEKGFALNRWRKVEVQNSAIFLDGSSAATLGNVILTNSDGESTVVDKSWKFFKASDGKVRIMGHHSSLPYTPASKADVTEAEVVAAQRAWGEALVNISIAFDQSGFAAAKAVAEQVIDAAYAYQFGPVLFKPTLAFGNQTFRTTRAGALAYFVGGDSAFPNDKGFAFNGWRTVAIDNAAIWLDGSTGTSIGNVILTDRNGTVTMVDKSWTFKKGTDGNLRIVQHHSSLPFAPVSTAKISEADVLSAQRAWGDALVNISTTYDRSGFAAAKAVAERVIDEAYGYQYGPVLFKPTLAYGSQTFRTSRAGALAYFVGGDPAYPNDKGFAFNGWRKVEIENAAIFQGVNVAGSVGNVALTDINGAVTVVDKTWQFLKGADGKLRIVGHHSSLPYLPASTGKVTEAELLAAQRAWGDALVNISVTYEQQGFAAAKARAERVIDGAYGYQYGPVLFKPTLTTGDQTFRTTRAGALAYFVGGDPAYPGDTGFALKGWRRVEIRNTAMFRDGNTGTTVGNVLLTDKNGQVTTVDKTWTFFKAQDGKLRIMAHHSSLPYVSPTPPSPSPPSISATADWPPFSGSAVLLVVASVFTGLVE